MNEIKKEKIVQFFRQMLEVYDFELVIDINKDLENVFRLNDIQNGNLNGINQEEFYTLSDIIERLDTYHQDIVYIPLENKKSNNEKIAKDDWDLVAKRYLESETVERALNEIDTKKYVDLISKKEKFDIQDIIKILDEDEQFCKSVCKKYVDTMSKEMLLEIDNKILHIFIEDEYIKLKEEGKINNQNYKDNKALTKNDTLQIPNIDFNVKKEYEELENNTFKFSNGEEYKIDKALQTIQFSLDKKGGKIRSEAGMMVNKSSLLQDNPREFLVNDTFCIFLKEKNKELPYFASKISDITKVQ